MKVQCLSRAASVLLFLSAFTFPGSAAEPASTEDLITRLQEAANQYSKNLKEKSGNTEDGRGGDASIYMSRWIQSIRQAFARGDLNSMQQALREVQSVFPDETVRKTSEELLTRIQDDLASKEKTYVEKVDKTVDQAVKDAFAAKSPKDLDPPILELSRLAQRPNDYNSSEYLRRTADRARSAVNFLCQWQDYLAQMQSGNTTEAQNVLRSISQNTSSYSFVSRSQILERIGPKDSKEGKAAPENVPDLSGKTLADLAALGAETDALVAKNPNQSDLRRFSDNLNELIRANSDFQSGMLGKAFYYCTNQRDEGRPSLSPLRQELLLKVLPIYLNVAQGYPAQAKESASEYLLRVIKEAKGKGDWTTVWKSLETYRTMAFSSGQAPGWLTADIQGCSNFISAQNFEKAGQYADAVRYYKRVLSQPGENLPATESTARLAIIQKEHPEEFEDAVKTMEARPLPVPTR